MKAGGVQTSARWMLIGADADRHAAAHTLIPFVTPPPTEARDQFKEDRDPRWLNTHRPRYRLAQTDQDRQM